MDFNLTIRNGFRRPNRKIDVRVYQKIDNTLKYLDEVEFSQFKEMTVSEEDSLTILLLPQFKEDPYHHTKEWEKDPYRNGWDDCSVDPQDGCDCEKKQLNDLDWEVRVFKVPGQENDGPTTNVEIGEPQ